MMKAHLTGLSISLSTVRSADRIYVVKGGSVVEAGSHEQLIENKNGVYTALISRQLESQRKLDGDDQANGSHSPEAAAK